MSPTIISVEGNIGSGKSTFIKYLKWFFRNNKKVVIVDEPVKEWEKIKDKSGHSFLEKFYADTTKYAFSF